MNDETVTVRIAIHLGGREPMRGVVESIGTEKPEDFVGWLGLLKVLEGSFAPEARAAPSRSNGGPPE